MVTTREIIQQYHETPIAGVSSNEPYGVGTNPEDAAIRERARDVFIDGGDPTLPDEQSRELKNIDSPDVNFPLLNAEELKEAERSLQQMLMQIIEDTETDEVIKNVAYEQIATKLAEVYRHLEVIRGLGRIGARQELSRTRAGDMTIELFGAPSKQVFDQYLSAERARALDIFDNSDDEVLVSIAREYLMLTGEAEMSDEAISSIELTDETIETMRGDLELLFPGLDAFRVQEIDHPLSPEESLVYFNQALELVGLAEKGWTSELSNGRAAKAEGGEKKILVGRNREPYGPEEMKGVAMHEAIHCLRYQNATEQDDPIKQRALPGNILVEEGITTAVEQIISGVRRVAGLPYYLSLGFQLGLDKENNRRHGFREPHEIMWRRSLLQKSPEHGMIGEQDIRNAKNTAYQTVIRTERGNSLDARDIAYFEGGRKATQWFNEIAQLPQTQRLEKLRWMVSGKFDITNPIQGELFEAATINESEEK